MAEITTGQMFPNVTLTIKDAKGRPAKVDGVPIWAVSDETVLRVTASADGMSADVDSVAPGVARVTVSVDTDLGTGVTNLTGISEDVTVTQDASSVASALALDLGAPEDKA